MESSTPHSNSTRTHPDLLKGLLKSEVETEPSRGKRNPYSTPDFTLLIPKGPLPRPLRARSDSVKRHLAEHSTRTLAIIFPSMLRNEICLFMSCKSNAGTLWLCLTSKRGSGYYPMKPEFVLTVLKLGTGNQNLNSRAAYKYSADDLHATSGKLWKATGI